MPFNGRGGSSPPPDTENHSCQACPWPATVRQDTVRASWLSPAVPRRPELVHDRQVVGGALSRQALPSTGEPTPADAARLATAGLVRRVPRPSTVVDQWPCLPVCGRAVRPRGSRSPADPWVRVASRRSHFGPLPRDAHRPTTALCAARLPRRPCRAPRRRKLVARRGQPQTRARRTAPRDRRRGRDRRRRQLGARPRRPGGRSSPPEWSGHARDAHEVPGRRTAAAR